MNRICNIRLLMWWVGCATCAIHSAGDARSDQGAVGGPIPIEQQVCDVGCHECACAGTLCKNSNQLCSHCNQHINDVLYFLAASRIAERDGRRNESVADRLKRVTTKEGLKLQARASVGKTEATFDIEKEAGRDRVVVRANVNEQLQQQESQNCSMVRIEGSTKWQWRKSNGAAYVYVQGSEHNSTEHNSAGDCKQVKQLQCTVEVSSTHLLIELLPTMGRARGYASAKVESVKAGAHAVVDSVKGKAAAMKEGAEVVTDKAKRGAAAVTHKVGEGIEAAGNGLKRAGQALKAQSEGSNE